VCRLHEARVQNHAVSWRILYREAAAAALHLIDPCVARVYVFFGLACNYAHGLPNGTRWDPSIVSLDE
jgi:hypothetical protein